ncbi:MAG: PepSY domain-containing protein [Elusimicrobiota bacterium]
MSTLLCLLAGLGHAAQPFADAPSISAQDRAVPAARPGPSPDYYKRLFENCKKKGSASCCMASVRRMEDGGFTLCEKSCPNGFTRDTLRCEDSYAWCAPEGEAPKPAAKPKTRRKARGPITRQKAIALAKEAVEKDVRYPPDTPIEVESKGARIIVTFKTRLHPNTLGPDYHARVTLDAATGRVLQVLGSQD